MRNAYLNVTNYHQPVVHKQLVITFFKQRKLKTTEQEKKTANVRTEVKSKHNNTYPYVLHCAFDNIVMDYQMHNICTMHKVRMVIMNHQQLVLHSTQVQEKFVSIKV